MSDTPTEDAKIVDWPTKVWKWADHNIGFTAAAALALVIFALFASGCINGTAIDPVTGDKATAAEIENSVQKAVNENDKQVVAYAQQLAVLQSKIEQLDTESDQLIEVGNARIDEANAKTQARIAFGQSVIDTASASIPGFQVFAPILGTLLGGGLIFDNIRKGKVIRQKKAKLGE